MEFDGKVILVTGATSGIGKACAIAFAKEGAIIAAVGRNAAALEQLQSLIPSRSVLPITAELMKESGRKNVTEKVLKEFGGIDILIHAAGIIATGTVETTRLELWNEMIELNVTAVFDLTQRALPSIIERKGNVVVVSSVVGLRSFPNVLAYAVSKAAVDHFTRCAALELAPKGVRVNAVNPGVVVTELHRRSGMTDEQYEAFLERSKTTHPMGRVGTPAEVAELVKFLASDRASWITGITCSIDGGRALTCAR